MWYALSGVTSGLTTASCVMTSDSNAEQLEHIEHCDVTERALRFADDDVEFDDNDDDVSDVLPWNDVTSSHSQVHDTALA